MIPLWANAAAATAVVLAAAALILPHGGGAPASVGAGIQAAPVHLTMTQGASRQVRVTVANTGSGTETLGVRPYHLAGPGHALPASWVHASSVTLPSAAEGISLVTVTVPAGTPAGRYNGDILASASPGGGPGGLSLGAAALASLIVTVAPSAS